MAESNAVTVVQSINRSTGEPYAVAKFTGVSHANVLDNGALTLMDGRATVAAFPAGEWVAYYQDDTVSSFGIL